MMHPGIHIHSCCPEFLCEIFSINQSKVPLSIISGISPAFQGWMNDTPVTAIEFFIHHYPGTLKAGAPASFPEIRRHFLQVLADRKVLGAFFLAFPALLAERGIMGDTVKDTA